MAGATWSDRLDQLLAWVPPPPEKEYNLCELLRDVSAYPSLLVNELLHVIALLVVSSTVYPRISPSWIYPVSESVDYAVFMVVSAGQFLVYRTRVDDMLAPFFYVFHSAVLKYVLHLGVFGVAALSIIYASVYNIDPEDAFLLWVLGPSGTANFLSLAPVVLNHITIIFRLAGLLLLAQGLLAMLVRAARWILPSHPQSISIDAPVRSTLDESTQ